MAKKLIVLSGLSGAGKTYERTTNPVLAGLPYVDMADIYILDPTIGWGSALNMAFTGLEFHMQSNDTIVLEGYFLKGSASRQWVDWMCNRNGWKVEYHQLIATYKECRERILAHEQRSLAATTDEGEKDEIRQFTEARLRLLEKYNEG